MLFHVGDLMSSEKAWIKLDFHLFMICCTNKGICTFKKTNIWVCVPLSLILTFMTLDVKVLF